MPSPSDLPHLVDCTMFWSPQGGGVQRYLASKRRWLLGHGRARHTIVAPGGQGPGVVDAGGVPLPGGGGYRVTLRRGAAAHLIAQQAPDLVEAADPYRLAWSALDAARARGVPCVAFCHSDLPALAARVVGGGRAGALAARAAGAYLGRLYPRFDLVLAPSQALAERLRDLGCGEVRRQALGVDTRVFRPDCRDPRLRRALGLPSAARLLLYAGRWAMEKNLEVLAAAVHRLGPDWWLLLAGAGARLPPGPRVLALAHLHHDETLARLMASADVFVHAGDQESFGLAALEAMACGTPVVVRDAAGLAELVRGGAGLAVPGTRPAAWAEAIHAAAASGREGLGRAARERALAHDWERVMPALWTRYQRLLGKPAAADPAGGHRAEAA